MIVLEHQKEIYLKTIDFTSCRKCHIHESIGTCAEPNENGMSKSYMYFLTVRSWRPRYLIFMNFKKSNEFSLSTANGHNEKNINRTKSHPLQENKWKSERKLC